MFTIRNKAQPTVQLNYDQLTKLYLALNGTPNTLFALHNLVPQANHQLHHLQNTPAKTLNPLNQLNNPSLEQIRELTTAKKTDL